MSLDPAVVSTMLTALDRAWEFYRSITGREPTPWEPTTHEGRSTIAVVDSALGWGIRMLALIDLALAWMLALMTVEIIRSVGSLAKIQGFVMNCRSGSAATLRRFLETATGTEGFGIEESPERPFHFRVSIPPAALPRLDLVRRIIAFEKPAFTTFELAPIPDAGPNQGS